MAQKLWEKSVQVNKDIEKFTVGRDREMDIFLAKHDVIGSMAHITMLQTIDLLTSEELHLLLEELKNIYATAAGIAHGLGYGDNFIAVLLANAAGEMGRFVDALSPETRDITDSPYLGDLLVTGYSQFSRNRTLGHMIGKGYSVSNALLEMTQVAEGYYASGCINEVRAKTGTDIPIADAVYRILYLNGAPAKEMKILSKKLK